MTGATQRQESRHLLRRFGARFFDAGVLLLTFLLVPPLLRAAGNTPEQAALVAQLVGVWAWFAYETALVARWGSTIGKRLAGVHVVTLDKQRPSAGAAARRALPVLFLVLPLLAFVSLLAWLSAAVVPDGRGLHDRIAGTRVALVPWRPDAG